MNPVNNGRRVARTNREPSRSRILEELFESAVENVEKQLHEHDATDFDDWELRKIAYTYYYDWENDDSNYVFLMYLFHIVS